MENKLEEIKSFLKNYSGPEITIMEVCGTHTASISENGIPDLLSEKIHLVSGPGCPVCVTVAAYIDRLVELSRTDHTCVVTFGDMLRVRGTKESLREAMADGGQVQMVYSPLDTIALAQKNPQTTYVFAAVGFETTTPLYAMLLDEALSLGLTNIRLLTALKTMPQVIDWVCSQKSNINGFLAPGHVSVITGSEIYRPLAEKYHIPFVVAGFDGPGLLAAIFALIKRAQQGCVLNFYPTAVNAQGNLLAQQAVSKYFQPCAAAWRGIGIIEHSGMELNDEYRQFDAGSQNLIADIAATNGCCCSKVVIGKLSPTQCPLFGKICTPQTPQGACMVSTEGSCYHYYINRRR